MNKAVVLVCLLLIAVASAHISNKHLFKAKRLNRFNAKVVPSGTVIHKQKNHDLKLEYPDGSIHMHTPVNSTIEPGTFGEPDGWRSSMWTWGNQFTYMTTKFVVPPAPQQTAGQCLFWFPSFEHVGDGGVDILQPVLQYNCNGHAGWTMASWYGSVQYVQSDSVPVQPGDQIIGVIVWANGCWYIESFHSGDNNPFTVLVIKPGADAIYFLPHNSAQVALEVYSVGNCNMYPSANPGSFPWSDIAMQDGDSWYTPNWTASNSETDCGASSSCVSPSLCNTVWHN